MQSALADQIAQRTGGAEARQQLLERDVQHQRTQQEIAEQPAQQAAQQRAVQQGPALRGAEQRPQQLGEGLLASRHHVLQRPLGEVRHPAAQQAGPAVEAWLGAEDRGVHRGGLVLLIGVLQQVARPLAQHDLLLLQCRSHDPGPVGAEAVGVLPDPFDAVDRGRQVRHEIREQLRAPRAHRPHGAQRLGVSPHECVHPPPLPRPSPLLSTSPYPASPAATMGRTAHAATCKDAASQELSSSSCIQPGRRCAPTRSARRRA